MFLKRGVSWFGDNGDPTYDFVRKIACAGVGLYEGNC